MPPGHDVGRLAEADALGVGGHRGLGEERIGAEFRSLRLEVVLGHEEIVEPEAVGENPLADLVHQHTLVRLVDLGEVPVVDDDPVLGAHARQVAGAVVEDADLEHAFASFG